MYTTKAKLGWQCGWVIGLALVSLVVPLATGILRQEPVAPFADPAHLSYYRQTVVALVLGLVCAVGALVGTRALMAAWLRWLSVVLASGGVLISGYLLWTLIGSCGVQVLWTSCHP